MGNANFNEEIISLEPSLTRYAYSLTADMDDANHPVFLLPNAVACLHARGSGH